MEEAKVLFMCICVCIQAYMQVLLLCKMGNLDMVDMSDDGLCSLKIMKKISIYEKFCHFTY